jgi:hypothetical protein
MKNLYNSKVNENFRRQNIKVANCRKLKHFLSSWEAEAGGS